MRSRQVGFLLILLTSCLVSVHLAGQVTVEKEGERWVLLVDGSPFVVKGVTFGYHDEVANYDRYFRDLQELGVNTIRTWGTDKNTPMLLDAAHAHGIKVMLGIWLRHGRPGMEDDDHFNYLEDTKGMEAMYAAALRTVEEYQGHPAVLMWGVGNEVYLNTATDAEKEAYSKFLERICRAIKKRDSRHPISSVEAWTFGLEWWETFVPSIDIYGLNSYGPGANYLAAELTKRGIDKPYIVTEFGVTGEWDMPADQNGVKIEPSDQQKYDAIVQGYHEWIRTKPACLGVYVFHYANGSDFFGAPWHLTHYQQCLRPPYWAIRAAFTGKEPLNQVPVIQHFELPQAETASGSWVPVSLALKDAEGDSLAVSFYYNQRSGSRKRRDQILPLNFRGNIEDGFEIQLPREDGPIKVYVHAKDTYPNLGLATASIVVRDEAAAQVKYQVPKASLPFYVYKDAGKLPYLPTGYMGNYSAIEVDLASTEAVYRGSTAIKISYRDRTDWYGLAFVDPPNDWGDILGGYDLRGARTLSFWARTSESTLTATAGFGLIEDDQAFPDTGKRSEEIVLTTDWQQFRIKTKKADLSCIRSGFVIFSSANGFPHDIYLDDIVFE